MCSYGLTNQTEFTLGLWQAIVALGGDDIEVSILLLKYLGPDPSLWLFLMRCFIDYFSLTKNGPLKGHVFNFK